MNRSAYNEFLILVNRCPLRSLRFLELLETQLSDSLDNIELLKDFLVALTL